jgi:hypothetical protein
LSSPQTNQVFTLDIDGNPTLTFEASGIGEASQICADADLRLDLSSLTCNGATICAANARLDVRSASEPEVAAFQRAVQLAPPTEQPSMVFLIKVDGVVVVAIDPT